MEEQVTNVEEAQAAPEDQVEQNVEQSNRNEGQSAQDAQGRRAEEGTLSPTATDTEEAQEPQETEEVVSSQGNEDTIQSGSSEIIEQEQVILEEEIQYYDRDEEALEQYYDHSGVRSITTSKLLELGISQARIDKYEFRIGDYHLKRNNLLAPYIITKRED